MSKLILETIFTIIFFISLIFNIITSSWFFAILDAILVILGIINAALTYKARNSRKKWERKSKKSSLWSPEATGSSLKGTEKDLTFSEKYAIIYIENERRDTCKFRHLPCAAVIEEWIVLIAQTMLPKERRSDLLAHGINGLQPAPTIRPETLARGLRWSPPPVRQPPNDG